MMRIQLQLILTAYIVNFVLKLVQPHNQIVHETVPGKVNDETKVQENFQNLFDSIAKNSTRKSEVYREALKHEVAKEQEVFDAMKEELWITQNRKANKRRNFYKRMTINENKIAVKRQASENERTTDDLLELERKYVGKFGDIYNVSGKWKWPEKNKMDEDKMMKVCEQAHRISQKPPGDIVFAAYYERRLQFLENYQPIELDMIFYLQDGLPHPGQQFYFYITKGLEPECVFYLNGTELKSNYYRLVEHVCGIEIPV